MPEISRFYGLIIRMFYDDHDPPHFHVMYGDDFAKISIADLTVLKGWLPPRATGLVMEWATIHKQELFSEWEAVRQDKPLFPIEPLR
ncbi:MAG: DUF4160 domain-containing protein [Candidatus Latescibacter sp.]|nr:DUF4160 domain-containing protein [Candidatus Latescibacter sp.]